MEDCDEGEDTPQRPAVPPSATATARCRFSVAAGCGLLLPMVHPSNASQHRLWEMACQSYIPCLQPCRRVGGGYEYERSERYTEALVAAAAYDTYRALPRDGAALTATDVAMLAEIFKAAEAEVDVAASAGRPTPVQQVRCARWGRANTRVGH